MKLIALVSFVGTVSAVARPFAPLNKDVVSLVPPRQQHEAIDKDLVAALQLRGGGDGILGTPITKKNLVALWALYNLYTGAHLPAPEKIPALFQHSPVHAMPEGSLAQFVTENVASTCLGMATMIYLSNFKSVAVPKTIAYGSMPCAYVFYKSLLKGTMPNLGMPSGFGALNVAIFLGFFYLIFGGGNIDIDPVLLSKIFCFMVTAMGAVGSVAPSWMADKVFSAGLGKGSAKCSFVWMFRVFAMWGFVAYSLLFDQDAMVTVGRLALIYALAAADSFFISKDAEEAGCPVNAAYALIGLGLIVGAGILLD